MEVKICKSTRTVKGCGKSKPDTEFKIIRVNGNTGKAYRKRLCRKCENKSYRVKKKHNPENETAIFNMANISW